MNKEELVSKIKEELGVELPTLGRMNMEDLEKLLEAVESLKKKVGVVLGDEIKSLKLLNKPLKDMTLSELAESIADVIKRRPLVSAIERALGRGEQARR